MKWLMLSIALVSSTPAYAVAVTTIGSGSQSCGKWLSARENNANRTTFLQMGSWAVGFLSGAVWVTSTDILANTDSDGVFYWLDNYCRANPTATFSDAVIEFYETHSNKP